MKACKPPEDPGKREIYELVMKSYQAYGDKDFEALRTLYPCTDDQVIFLEGPQMKIVGWNAFETFFQQFCNAYDDLVCTPAADFCFVRPSDNAAFAFGTVVMVCKERASGFLVRWMDRTTICFEKQEGEWKMIHHHDSVPNSLAFIMEPPEEGADGSGYW